MAEGRSNAAIAELLHIAEKSVVRHASHVYAQLGIKESRQGHRRVLAVVKYLSWWPRGRCTRAIATSGKVTGMSVKTTLGRKAATSG